MQIGGGFLSEIERQLFIDILFEFEGAVAFDDSEMGLLDPMIEPPVKIHTIPHQPWQQFNLRFPKAISRRGYPASQGKIRPRPHSKISSSRPHIYIFADISGFYLNVVSLYIESFELSVQALKLHE